jgi:8-oxo-dGTP diphosphatase
MTALLVSVAIIHRKGRIFFQRRSIQALHFPGRWELPGGKVEKGERPMEALLRELTEELDWHPLSCHELPVMGHVYREFAVELHPFRCECDRWLGTALAWGWFSRAEALRLPLPEATRRLLEENLYILI